ncbi:Hypothetical_protein [Hexamita inflata]|uniref:Hypothetical_protein n=1 Tax=Hexamita inflata TaxID=28002 RepID=A0AA86U945_9EUKA|nr:Hypothetical protein HINF_LOCUS29882 [Hexamita inflata]
MRSLIKDLPLELYDEVYPDKKISQLQPSTRFYQGEEELAKRVWCEKNLATVHTSIFEAKKDEIQPILARERAHNQYQRIDFEDVLEKNVNRFSQVLTVSKSLPDIKKTPRRQLNKNNLGTTKISSLGLKVYQIEIVKK